MIEHQTLNVLRRRELSFAEAGHRLSPPATRQTVLNTAYRHGIIYSTRIRAGIAKAIECDLKTILPELSQGTDIKRNNIHNTQYCDTDKDLVLSNCLHASRSNHAQNLGFNAFVRGGQLDMARRRTTDPRQSDLFRCFEVPQPPDPTPGSLNFGLELRSTLSQILKESPRSRYEVAAHMSEPTGAEVSKHQLDAWTAESREGWRFPFEYAAAFGEATDTFALTELLARKRGCKVLVGEEALRTELGKLELIEAEIRQQKKDLKRAMTKQGISVRESRK